MKLVISTLMFSSISAGAYLLAQAIQKRFGDYEDRITAVAVGQLQEAFIFLSPKALAIVKIMAVCVLALIGVILTGSLAYASIFAAAGYLVPQLGISYIKKRRLEKFELQLPDTMQNLSNGMKAGFTIVQAIESMVSETPPPMSQEFGLVLREYSLGVQLDDALLKLGARIKSADLNLVITAINITRQMGGNLPEMLEKIAYTIRERRRIEGKNKSLTSQGKLQGIVVGSLPIGMGFIFYALDPKMMSYMWTTGAGLLMIFIMVVMEILGFVFIRKIVNIDI